MVNVAKYTIHGSCGTECSKLPPELVDNDCHILELGEVTSVHFTPGWLFDIGDEILPNYIWIIISQYKDAYKPISTMECHKGFERCSSYPLSKASFLFATASWIEQSSQYTLR